MHDLHQLRNPAFFFFCLWKSDSSFDSLHLVQTLLIGKEPKVEFLITYTPVDIKRDADGRVPKHPAHKSRTTPGLKGQGRETVTECVERDGLPDACLLARRFEERIGVKQ